MKMGIVDREKTSSNRSTKWIAGQLIVTGLLFHLACCSFVFGQSGNLGLAEKALDNGEYSTAVTLATKSMQDAANRSADAHLALDVLFLSQLAQQKYEEAAITLDKWSKLASLKTVDSRRRAYVHLRAADLSRAKRQTVEALRHAQTALEVEPSNLQIRAEYYLQIGRIMYSSGYDLSAIVWLEKAEKLYELGPVSSSRLDVYRFLSLAWSAKLNYPAATRYSEKLIAAAAGTRFKRKHSQALFEAATLFSSIGRVQKASALQLMGLKQSLERNDTYQARKFLFSLVLNALYKGDVSTATKFLQRLQDLDTDNQFGSSILLSSAVIAGYSGKPDISENLFRELDSQKSYSAFVRPSWIRTVAEKNKEWEKVIEHNRTLLELTLAQNFREDLPGIYLSLATAFLHLDEDGESLEYLDKALSLIEEIRVTDSKSLSLALLETYHKAYRLLTQIKLEQPLEAFEMSDYLKARLLKDKINNNPANIGKSDIAPELRKKLEALSLRMIEEPDAASEISKLEASFTKYVPERKFPKPDFSGLDSFPDLENKAVVSYLFTVDQRLLAFVFERGKPVRSAYIPISEDEVEAAVLRTEQKIKNRIFFKRDGKELFDKLLKPLGLSAKHIIIVPDKHLWKVPFQALSADGERYLIEDKLISYAPSVSILLEQLKAPKPVRRTIEVFANPSFDNKFLKYVNSEATAVAGLFGSRPILNATISDYRRQSDQADILHFSMHAQVDNDDPLNSFLGFKRVGAKDGRLTVESILNSRLKQGSLVFLASCDTNNVLSGEGLVSLAWGMTGAGATSVISAQWEANDKLTGAFSEAFYKHYKTGLSSAAALQRASVEMIKAKSNDMHEPYYWADFTLSGDFR